jgi:hypothetical protein
MSNDISTILLLIVLGLLIFYLCKPNDICKQNDILNNKQLDHFDNQQQESNIQEDLNNQSDIISNPSDIINKPSLIDNINTSSFKYDGDFEPNDLISSGATIDDAFKVQNFNIKPEEIVDLNKSNVQNFNAKDFLPKEINNNWFDTDFSQAKYNINDDKLINTDRYVIGINTVGQSLKNASYDIRGTVPNPKYTVSPWNNSTYEPDFNIKPLC